MTPNSRRRFLQSTLSLSSLLVPDVMMAQSASKKDAKKGYATGLKSAQQAGAVTNLKVKWIYNWTSKRPAGLPEGVEWVPMVFKDNESQFAAKAVEEIRADLANKPSAVLGFNEPEGKDQANMTVEQALSAWPKLEELNLPLGSPAGVHADSPWMQSFMKEALKRKYRIDFITIHWYGGPTASQFLSHIDKIARLYKRPLWITEFCPADWTATKTGKNQHEEKDVLRFIKDALPRLERSNDVERYAWFGTAPGNTPTGCSALCDASGALTKLGEAYAEA
ncbi:MAG: glycosyl hydrolase [Verrucomicrobiaceae bacterium]